MYASKPLAGLVALIAIIASVHALVLPPTSLSSSAVSQSTVTLSWSAPLLHPGGLYRLYYKPLSSSAAAVAWPSSSSTLHATEAVLTGLSADTTYQFYVVAVDLLGESLPSNLLTVNTPVATSSLDSYGSAFTISFAHNYPGCNELLRLFLTSAVDATVTVSSGALAEPVTVLIPANQFVEYVVDNVVVVRPEDAGTPVNKGIRLTSDQEFSVNGLNECPFSTDGFLAYPEDVLGNQYTVMSWNDNPGRGQIPITAIYDNTVVSITTPVSTVGQPASTFEVILNAGQVYLVETDTPIPDPFDANFIGSDLSGTTLFANKPVAVFGDNSCGQVPDSTVDACDKLTEMIPASSTWGRRVAIGSFASRTGGDTVRIMARDADTNVRVTLTNTATVTYSLGAAEWVQLDLPSGETLYAEGNNPIQVWHYMKGQASDASLGDPISIIETPTAQFSSSYSFSTPGTEFNDYINVLARTTDTDGVYLDGVQVNTLDTWQVVAGSIYSVIRLEVSVGIHSVVQINSQPLGLTSYGVRGFDGYGFAGAGLRFDPISLCIPSAPVAGDAVDNDCDGLIDEELLNGLDDDNDGRVDEDLRLDNSILCCAIFTGPAGRDVECPGSTSPADIGTPTFLDPCNILAPAPQIHVEDAITPGCGNAKTITRTFWALTACGQNVTVQQIIRVRDTAKPMLTLVPSASVSLSCGADTSVAAVGQATASDACSATGAVTSRDIVTPIGNCGLMTIIREFSVADACGNVAKANQTISVRDTVQPSIVIPADKTITCTDSTLPSFTGQATATDNCGTPVVTYADDVSTAVTCPAIRQIRRMWTATDCAGNVQTGMQTITVRDTVAPVLTVPATFTGSCGTDTTPATTGQATATDGCSGAVTPTYTDTTVNKCGNTKTITRTWKAVDACNNQATAVQTIQITDTVLPMVTIAAASVPCCSTLSDLTVTGTPTISDNCTPTASLTMTYTDSVANPACGTSFTRTFTVTDLCGNARVATQTISIKTTGGSGSVVVTPPADKTVACDAKTTPTQTGTATGTTTCAAQAVTITYSDNVVKGNCENNYKILRTWKGKTSSGTTGTAVQTINVVDNVAPTIYLPRDLTLQCTDDWDANFAGFAWAKDNCDGWNLSADEDSNDDRWRWSWDTLSFVKKDSISISFQDTITGGCGQSKVVKRKWTATDTCGNSRSDVQTINIRDIVAPQWTVTDVCLWPANRLYYCWDNCHNTNSFIHSWDNCDGNVRRKFLSCKSSQPLNSRGDGDTNEDCDYDTSRNRLCIRADRSRLINRVYTVKFEVSDSCNSPKVVTRYVKVDGNCGGRSGALCANRSTRRGLLSMRGDEEWDNLDMDEMVEVPADQIPMHGEWDEYEQSEAVAFSSAQLSLLAFAALAIASLTTFATVRYVRNKRATLLTA